MGGGWNLLRWPATSGSLIIKSVVFWVVPPLFAGFLLRLPLDLEDGDSMFFSNCQAVSELQSIITYKLILLIVTTMRTSDQIQHSLIVVLVGSYMKFKWHLRTSGSQHF
jgi:ACR3 family arsenite efflux pump ArsB